MSENNQDNIFTEAVMEDIEPVRNEIIEPDTNLMEVFSSSQRRIRPREDLQPKKYFKNLEGKRIVQGKPESYRYLCLKSGEEFYFDEDDDKRILLKEYSEPNKLIRNIVSKVPVGVKERMIFLAKFESDEESDDDGEKVKRRYFGTLKELVYKAFIKEWRLRFIFKRVLLFWRMWKMNKTFEKEIDPITLSEPEKEVYLYDWANKKKFIFDAKSLATMIESKLMYCEYGFPVPMYPKNPKNNVEFSYKQLISIFNQLKKYGELKWGFITLRKFNFNKNRWHLYHKSALTMNAIKSSILLLDSLEARELFLDFIFAKMDELNYEYDTTMYNVYNVGMIKLPNHWYLEKLKGLAILHYETAHFGQSKTRIINVSFLRILKYQHKFITDLENKRFIN